MEFVCSKSEPIYSFPGWIKEIHDSRLELTPVNVDISQFQCTRLEECTASTTEVEMAGNCWKPCREISSVSRSMEQAVQTKHRSKRHFFSSRSVGKNLSRDPLCCLCLSSRCDMSKSIFTTKKRIFKACFFLYSRHCLYSQEGWPGKSKMWYLWYIAWQLVSGADLVGLYLAGSYILCSPYHFGLQSLLQYGNLLIHILVDAQAKAYDLTQVHLIWITHCIFDIVKEHNISMKLFANKRDIVQIWGSQDGYKTLRNVCQYMTCSLPHF